ncbi:hypothetical protein [Photobacterium atrarenae]|uniref:Uncharacterized protein n=1 Tax=Photobacterium atrarenae TaxID=865757 RepID=A0ABY5GI35_9GAMM|nr:hypothetical protein [Photobacterium atrarenae]UTV28942.1 hypothetical protein NNL38_06850 [Photobacterium atrarenae]
MAVAACGGGGSSTQITAPDQAVGKQVSFAFINTTAQAIDYFLKRSDNSSALFDGNHRVVSNSVEVVQRHTENWTSNTPLTVDVGAMDTNSQTTLSTMSELITNNGEQYWLLSWNDDEAENESQLTAIRFAEATDTDKIYIRFFSLADLDISVLNESMFTSSKVQKGQVSSQQLLDGCAGELFLGSGSNLTALNLCGEEVEVGHSYLLVMDGETLIRVEKEQ